MAVYTFYNVMF